MYTQERRDATHLRDREERAGEGGIRQLLHYALSKHGTADWRVNFFYNDGTTWEVTGPSAARGVPALA